MHFRTRLQNVNPLRTNVVQLLVSQVLYRCHHQSEKEDSQCTEKEKSIILNFKETRLQIMVASGVEEASGDLTAWRG
jgi:hypothetical protein